MTLHDLLLSTDAIENVMRNYRAQTAKVSRWRLETDQISRWTPLRSGPTANSRTQRVTGWRGAGAFLV